MPSRSRRLAALAATVLTISVLAAACGAASTPAVPPTSIAPSSASTAVAPATPSGASAGAASLGPPSTTAGPSPTASAMSGAGADGTATPGSTVAPSQTSSAPGSPTSPPATPAPSESRYPPLPGLLGAIGDSISVGYNAVPTIFGAQPSHSWVFGTDPNDGILSHLERLRQLGARPAVEPAARAGARMSDIVRQATLVVESASRLPRGETAYVTIELGANDLCRDEPSLMTDPATFAAELRAGLDVLRNGTTTDGGRVAGLPRGSLILVLSVPDVLRLRRLVVSDPLALAIHVRFGQCRAAVDPGRTAAELRVVAARIAAFDRALRDACAAIQSRDGPSGRLSCRDDQAGDPADSFTGAPLTLIDLSRLDYFHPSLEGQSRIADGSWAAGYWSGLQP